MRRLIAGANWRFGILVTVAVAVAILVALALRPSPVDPATSIAPADAYRLSRAGELTIVDVRAPREWRQTGVPEGASTVTIHDPGGLAGFASAVADAVDGDRDTPLALICAAGERSSRARSYLADQGFTRVHDISAGMLGRDGRPGWLEQGLPVEPCDC